jgi:hypothetical protein
MSKQNIVLQISTKQRIDALKLVERESYDSCIVRMLDKLEELECDM